MESVADITWRVEFIETTLKNSNLLLRLLYDVDDAKNVQEDIGEAEYDLEVVLERYCDLANRVQTQQSVYTDMCKERIEFQDKIKELEEKLGIVKDSKKTGIRNVALKVFKNKQSKDVIKISNADRMLILGAMNDQMTIT